MPVLRKHKRIRGGWVTKFCIGENCAVLHHLKSKTITSYNPDPEV